MHFQIK